MINSLNQFNSRVEQLISFLDDAETINALLNSNSLHEASETENAEVWSHIGKMRSTKMNRKVHTYASGIILLYGLFEQYVEDVLIAYLDELDSIIYNFLDLPEVIRSNHSILSAQLLLNIKKDLDKYRDRCSEIDIIQRMHSCINNEPFQLNAIAFTDHKSNFRIDSLNHFFEPIGISGMSRRIKQTNAFNKLKTSRFQTQRIQNLPDNVVFFDLNDLAWRRNVVAHSWPDDTLSIELMKERIDFIFTVGKAIYEVLRQNVLPYIVKYRGHALPKPLVVYRRSIVCFHIDSLSISKGSQIIARRPNGCFLEGKIMEIQVDHVQNIEVVAPPPIDVALRVDFSASPNYDYFLVTNS